MKKKFILFGQKQKKSISSLIGLPYNFSKKEYTILPKTERQKTLNILFLEK